MDIINVAETTTVISTSTNNNVIVSVPSTNTITTAGPGPVGATGAAGPKGDPGIELDLSQLTNGALLVYQENIATWIATRTLEDQIMNGGFF